MHKIALLHSSAETRKLLKPYRGANIFFPCGQNAKTSGVKLLQ
jgi:hypothetical protein